MQTLTPQVPQTPEEQINQYGYRDVRTTLPNGKVEVERIPLTLDDLLHPQFGDVAMVSSLHEIERDYLAAVFRSRLTLFTNSLVLTDCKIDWAGDTDGIGHHAPDVCVLMNVHEKKNSWPSFSVAEQGTRPSLIVEIASPAYRQVDTVEKVSDFLQCRVPCYVIVDRESIDDPPTLIGRIRRGNSWRMMQPTEEGWLWLEAIGVFIGVESYRIRCYDSDKKPIADPVEWLAEANLQRSQVIVDRQYRERAEAKAEQADIARLAAEARIAELEAKLQSLEPNNPPTP